LRSLTHIYFYDIEYAHLFILFHQSIAELQTTIQIQRLIQCMHDLAKKTRISISFERFLFYNYNHAFHDYLSDVKFLMLSATRLCPSTLGISFLQECVDIMPRQLILPLVFHMLRSDTEDGLCMG
jgi:hypothetical protein